MRVWFNGRTSAFQADDAGSTPVTRSTRERSSPGPLGGLGCFCMATNAVTRRRAREVALGLRLGRTLVIANPAAQSGAGAQGAEFVRRTLEAFSSATDGFDLRLTTGPGNATQMARAATGFETVLALGGDGVIHEVVNGLMHIDASRRPRLGIIPLGSGNDYARTLGMAKNAPEVALGQILRGVCRRVDLGLVNGTYFDETLSFGVDAAIALDTMRRRKAHGAHGTRLFMGSGLDIIRHQISSWPFTAAFDGEQVTGSSIVFAVQVGPTYGGGFRICPDADSTDGLLDVCYSHGDPSTATALATFARARIGLHTHSPYLGFLKAKSISIDFEGEPPCQADGERLVGAHFKITCAHRALEVITPTLQG